MIFLESLNNEEGKWVNFICREKDLKAKFISVETSSGTFTSITVCEIEVYAKDGKWCEDPPQNVLRNSQLIVSRNETVLSCNKGFKKKHARRVYATCENNKWVRLLHKCEEILCDPFIGNIRQSEGTWDIEGNTSELSIGTRMTLKCMPGYHSEGEPLTVTCSEKGNWTRTSATCKKNKHRKNFKITAIVVGLLAILVIFILFGLKIFLTKRKKAREIAVVCNFVINNRYSTLASIGGHSNGGLSEAEYSNVDYEAIQNNRYDFIAPSPIPPQLESGYSKTVDYHLPDNKVPIYQLPIDLAHGTITKSNSLYNATT